MPKNCQTIKIGCRPSKLAIAQTKQVEATINQHFPSIQTSLHTFKTEGDLNQHQPLYELGGKNIFIKTLETQLLNKKVDLVVHSLKDITTKLAPSLVLAGIIKGPSIRDCIILNQVHRSTIKTLSQLPKTAKIGTSSLRRIAQLKQINPQFTIIPMRGNIDTRIKKLHDQNLDAILLAEAGLIRLDIEDNHYIPLDEKVFIPAPNQGLLGLEIRETDPHLAQICQSLSDTTQSLFANAQIALISSLNLNCNHPFGSYIDDSEEQLFFNYFLSNTTFTHHSKARIPVTKKSLATDMDDIQNTLQKKRNSWPK
ncbi:MAG: hydroxymethylbilane synthase [bacterium]